MYVLKKCMKLIEKMFDETQNVVHMTVYTKILHIENILVKAVTKK